MGKPHLAGLYFRRALQENQNNCKLVAESKLNRLLEGRGAGLNYANQGRAALGSENLCRNYSAHYTTLS